MKAVSTNILINVIQNIVLIIAAGDSVLINKKEAIPNKRANRVMKSIGINLIVK